MEKLFLGVSFPERDSDAVCLIRVFAHQKPNSQLSGLKWAGGSSQLRHFFLTRLPAEQQAWPVSQVANGTK